MKLGSLFDGSGGFPLAGALCGITPAFASEVEPYPIAVTTSRFPTMKHLGSVTDINGAEIEPVDIITFGSPCQDLSVAGKRAGLKHEANGDEETTRSGLFMEAVRIIKEMRRATNGLYPTFAVWENVPGAFSSNRGEDFRIVLEELIKIVEPGAVMPTVPQKGWAYADCYCGDGWSLAYRTLDAQYWGVPQRRRRIYLVLDLRGERAHKVLFEREGLRGYFTEGRAPWKATARNAENCPGADDRAGNGVIGTFQNTGIGWWNESPISATIRTPEGGDSLLANVVCMATQQGGAEIRTDDKAPTITAAAGMSGNNQPVVCYEKEQHLFENHSQDSRYKGPLDVSPMLPAQLGTGGNNQPLVVESKVYESHPMDSRIKELEDVAPTVSRKWHKGAADTPLVCEATIPIHDQTVYCLQGNGIDRADTAGCNGKGVKEDICYTLNTIDRPAVCYAETYQKVTGPLMANSHPGSYCGQDAYQDMLVVGKEIPSVGINGDIAGTLDASYYKGCGMRQGVEREVVAFDRAAFNQGQNAQYTPQYYTDGTVPTLVAKGPSGVAYKEAIRYIVRRLTPTECARLQGFPDTWGHINPKEDLTDEEYRFWLEVRNTHAAINGKATKEYTKAQMLTWYSKLHTDSAEYKMWGNGIALPTALYVMQGIAEALE